LKSLLKSLAAAGFMLAVASAADARTQSYPNWARVQPAPQSLAQRLVAAHNAVRASAGTQPLAWDAALAARAQAYARQLAATGAFQHSDRRARPGIGENLWMGSSGAFSPEQMVGNWASERQWFRPGIFPNVSRTGHWEQIGHYSQIIWRTTTRVGCGLARGAGRDVLVCRYSPAGNVDGRPVT
jgi:hypothetical protein